jgi:isocitrate dehydrogenase (NAD+)
LLPLPSVSSYEEAAFLLWYQRLRSAACAGTALPWSPARACHPANFLYMLTGQEANELSATALETYFVLLADHGMNASTFSARVTASTLGDVLVCPNLFSDILSDLCSGLVGGLGVVPGASFGHEIAVFEPVHGSAPKYTGQNKVNPMATILMSLRSTWSAQKSR